MALLDSIRNVFGSTSQTPTLPELAAADQQHQEFLQDAARIEPERLERYTLYDDYYCGEQRTQVMDRAAEYLEASGLRFCENFYETIIDALTDRLRITNFTIDDGQERDDEEEPPAQAWLNMVWQRNRADALQRVVHHDAVNLGDAFVMVEPDTDGQPVYRRQRPEQIKPCYGDDGELLHVAKVWGTSRKGPMNPEGEAVRRLNLYFPERIEKWFSLGSGDGAMWAPWVDVEDMVDGVQVLGDDGTPYDMPADELDDDADLTDAEPVQIPTWPLPWTMDGTPEGEPIGINLIHFRHKPLGGTYGRSRGRGVIPQQDALNKSVLDLFYVLDAHGWSVRWATGIPGDVSLKVAPGEILKATDPNAKFGQLDPSEVAPILGSLSAQLQRMALKSQTPIHMLLADASAPSGESLKTAYAGLVAAAQGAHTDLGNAWEDTQRIAARIAEAFGAEGAVALPDDVVIDAVWDDVEPRNDADEALMYESYQRLGVSKRTILARLGFDPDTERDQREDEAEGAMEAGARAFDAGRGGFGAGNTEPPANEDDEE